MCSLAVWMGWDWIGWLGWVEAGGGQSDRVGAWIDGLNGVYFVGGGLWSLAYLSCMYVADDDDRSSIDRLSSQSIPARAPRPLPALRAPVSRGRQWGLVGWVGSAMAIGSRNRMKAWSSSRHRSPSRRSARVRLALAVRLSQACLVGRWAPANRSRGAQSPNQTKAGRHPNA